MRAYQAAYYIDGLERNRLDNKQRDGSSIRIARLLFGRASISSEEIRERTVVLAGTHTHLHQHSRSFCHSCLLAGPLFLGRITNTTDIEAIEEDTSTTSIERVYS